ncbi:NUDIX hydrolase [Kitasatospora camelliae]|uniref:NUDIX domain-containing protein n=1 Tax=Kitasatospora camelliae TaxID=3156397 RepID=A0AAU8K6B0_9ACTN
MPHSTVIGVHLGLVRQDRVLLGLRHNTPFADRTWHLPAGHLEQGESVAAGMAREAQEELGLDLDPAALRLVHVLHDLDADDRTGRLQLFFRPEEGAVATEPDNREPDRCAELRWWPLDALPDPTVPYTRRALAAISAGHPLTVHGFPA